ncbi:FAD binding domain-containing protein [Chloroflexota bacterium]
MKQLQLVDIRAIDETLALLSEYWGEEKRVEHYDAETIDEAGSLLERHKDRAKVIAGGVDIVRLMNSKVMFPGVLVNIKTIPDLSYITDDATGLKIGTLTTIGDIEKSALLKGKYPMLAKAAHLVSSPLVRNMATIAGDLCQSATCWYYRLSPLTGCSFFCQRKGGEQCYAVTGDNTYHAIFGGGKCRAAFSSDMAVALTALGASVKVAGPLGYREIPLEEFYTGMGNTLDPDEIITEINVPTLKPGTRQQFLKFRLRKTIDFAISSVAAAITTEAGVVSEARILLGGVATTPYRARAAEETIKGKVITESVAEIAAKAAVSEAAPLSKNAYKLSITRALVKRAIVD